MRSGRFSHAFVATVLLFGMLAAPGRPQQQQQQQPAQGVPNGTRPSNPSNPFPDSGKDPNLLSIEQRQARARNDERQRRLVADTDKLLALATQLHDDVGKTDKNILSLDVVHRAEEIEKLAHNVKERMKG